MTSEAAIQKGKGIVSNPEFFLAFFISAAMGVAGVLTVGVSGMWGWLLIGIVAVLAAVAHFSGLGQRFFVILLSLAGVAAGVTSAIVIYWLWGIEHQQPLWGALLALLMAVIPVASIAGEKILPLFVALLAGLWGIISVIVFVMVVFMGGGE